MSRLDKIVDYNFSTLTNYKNTLLLMACLLTKTPKTKTECLWSTFLCCALSCTGTKTVKIVRFLVQDTNKHQERYETSSYGDYGAC